MKALKPAAGQTFPALTVPKWGGGTMELSRPGAGHDWRLLVVYRGKHCPLCTRYLQRLNELAPDFAPLGVDVAAVSGDSAERVEEHMASISPTYELGYDLTVEQMTELGLYISAPGLGMGTERPFAEPGLFVVNEHQTLQMVDISNVPFARPDFDSMLSGIAYVKNLNEEFPINGSLA